MADGGELVFGVLGKAVREVSLGNPRDAFREIVEPRRDPVKHEALRDTVKKEDGDGSCCDDDREGDCKGALEHMATDFRVVPEECDVVASLLVEIEARAS